MITREISDLARKYQNQERFFDGILPRDVECAYCVSSFTITDTSDLSYGSRNVGYGAYETCLRWKCPACGCKNTFTSDRHTIMGFMSVTGTAPHDKALNALFLLTIVALCVTVVLLMML